jgi:hypothetical protein
MSEALKKFLSEWLEWAESGAQGHEAFDRSFGLCANLGFWLTENILDIPWEEADTAEREFGRLLHDEFGDEYMYPFGRVDYLVRGNNGTQHLNEARLAWARKQLGK